MWILLSLSGAVFQALGGAFQKRAIKEHELKLLLGALIHLFAGILVGIVYFLKTGTVLGEIHNDYRFWNGMFWYTSLNVIATIFFYKALSIAEFNYLAPFATLTSLTIMVPSAIFLGEIPGVRSAVGIAIVVSGAILMNLDSERISRFLGRRSKSEKETQIENNVSALQRSNRKGLLYFLGTAACYTFTPTATKIAIQESSPLFVTMLVLLLISFSFFILLMANSSRGKLFLSVKDDVRNISISKLFIWFAILAGIVNAIENTSINQALVQSQVSYVFAIKRTMPIFAFLIGYYWFKEKSQLLRKSVATILMVLGAVIISIYS